MHKLITAVALATMASACSTAGGWYKEGDPVNGELSTWRTVALPFAAIGVIAGAAVVGAAAAYSEPAPTTVIIVCPRHRRC